jgi:hypothetical protein
MRSPTALGTVAAAGARPWSHGASASPPPGGAGLGLSRARLMTTSPPRDQALREITEALQVCFIAACGARSRLRARPRARAAG